MQIFAPFVLPAYRRKALLIFFPALCLMVSVFSLASWQTGFLKSVWSATGITPQAANPETERIKVLHFTLTPRGFNPVAATIPEGRYVIEVTNRSELPEFSLNLGRLSGHKIKERDNAKKHGEWSGLFDLKRGDFVLSINEKPEWTANIQATKEEK